IRNHGLRGDGGRFIGSLALDGAAGVFRGFSPLPTVGGVGSLDVLAGIGLVFPPTGAGFRGGSKGTWALGARLGILRESFTFPGVSVTGMYRRFGRVQIG